MQSLRVGLLAAVAVLGLSSAPATARARPESGVQRHHRKGMQCVNLERPDCAKEHFEAVLGERTTERELVTDSMLRLIKLYRHDADTEAIKEVMRAFWDAGMKRKALGHLPYGARFFPPELDMLFSGDMEQVAAAPLTKEFSGYAEMFFTCDELRRAEVEEELMWERAQRKSIIEGRPAHEIIYREMDEETDRERHHKHTPPGPPPGGKSGRAHPEWQAPIFAEATCALARALGDDDLREWKRMAGAMNHHDFTRSMGVAQIPQLDEKAAAAVRAGRLQQVGTDRWVLRDLKYHGRNIHIAKVDLDEVVMAPDTMIEPVLEARSNGRTRLHKDIVRLVSETPRDASFFGVMTTGAIEGMGFSGMRSSTAGFLQALLPKPKGLQFAAVVHEDLGVFTRMPTNNAIKGRLLVRIAQYLVDGAAQGDAEMERMIRHLDIGEARDKRALLLTYLLTSGDIWHMIDA